MYPRRMMAAGAILALAAAGILLFGLFIVGEREEAINGAAPFDGSAAGAGGTKGLIVVEGKVSAKNRVLVYDFVYGAMQANEKGGTWTIRKMYSQPFIVDLGNGEVILDPEDLCTEGSERNFRETGLKDANGRPTRYVGLKRGDPITAIGQLVSSAPATVAVRYCYAGSAAGYRESLASSRRNGFIACPILALVGALMFLWGYRRR
jgi:hypothetical protein